jgi:hypothetical protein
MDFYSYGWAVAEFLAGQTISRQPVNRQQMLGNGAGMGSDWLKGWWLEQMPK